MSRSRGSLRAVAGALFCLLSAAAHAQTGYTIQGLSGFGTNSNHRLYSIGRALNSKGVVTGTSSVYDAQHNGKGSAAFLSLNGGLLNLGNFGTDPSGNGFSYAFGVNIAGQVVGYSAVYDAMHNAKGNAAVLWQNGTMTNLGNMGTDSSGISNSLANGINTTGQVVGYSYVYDATHNSKGRAAVLWDNGKMTDLGNFGTDSNGAGTSWAYSINDQSQIVGYSAVYDAMHNAKGNAAFLWQTNIRTNLGTLGTDSSGSGDSQAYGINNHAQVAGDSTLYDSNHNNLGIRPFLWQNNTMTQLPVLNTNSSNVCYASAQTVNDKGQIVGSSYRYDSNGNFIEQDAVLWPNATTIINLNDYLPPNSGWVLNSATGINNRGQIAGVGTHNGAQEAFLLTPYIAGDFNNDGSPDILLRNSQTGDLVLGVMNTTSLMGSQPILSAVPSVWKVAATPDLNGDGYADILWQNSQTGDIAFWLMNNGRYQSYGYLYRGLPLNWKVVASADFNADGYTDLVLQDSQSGTIAIWYLTNAVYYTYGLIGTNPGTNWQVVGAGDFNGDGQPDLLLRSKANGDLYAWLLNGLTVSKGVLLGNVPLSWSLVGVGDYGGDGNASLLWQNANNDLYYWLMNGTTIASYGLIQSGVPNWQVVGPK